MDGPLRPAFSALALALALVTAGCASVASSGGTPSTSASTATVDRAAPPPSSTTSLPTATSTTSSPTTTSTTTTTTSTTTTTTSTTAPTTTAPTAASTEFPTAHAEFDRLAMSNPAVSLTVLRDGQPMVRRASGTTIDGTPATSDSPMVVASVGKLLTALQVARLEQAGLLAIDAPVAWDVIGITPHPGWLDVTVGELLAHTSGMPVVRRSWFDGVGDCRSFLPTLLADPPQAHRSRWTYSNGNYCALGLLVESITGVGLGAAAQGLLLDVVGADGVHLTTEEARPGDVPHAPGPARLSRLGGAGTYVISTDDIAAVLATRNDRDGNALRWPGVFADQYGWGHTGTVDGAKACAWVLEAGRTVVVATVAGNSPDTGGGVCDRIVPAVAVDLGIGAGQPDRSPP